MTLAQLVKDARNARGWSLREAAKHLATGHVHLWEIEKGRHINITIKTAIGFQAAYAIKLPVLWAAMRESVEQESRSHE